MERDWVGILCSVAFALGSASTALQGSLGRSAQELKGALGNYQPGVSSATGQVLCLPSAWVRFPGLTFPLFFLPGSPFLRIFLCLFFSLSLPLSLSVPFSVTAVSLFSHVPVPHTSLSVHAYARTLIHTHKHRDIESQLKTTHVYSLSQKHPYIGQVRG